jgi:PIN domain nuclease of toxin-antitoxin system
MILLDTHVVLWWALAPDKLSAKAKRICEEMERSKCLLSSTSIWELGIKIKKGKLEIRLSIEEFVQLLRKTGVLEIVPIDEKIWMKNLSLKWSHKNPVGRTLVATTLLNQLPVLTKDEVIHRYRGVKSIW